MITPAVYTKELTVPAPRAEDLSSQVHQLLLGYYHSI